MSATRWCAIATAVAFAVLVSDGTAPWPAIRGLIVLAAGAACLWTTHRLGRRTAAVSQLTFGLAGIITGMGIGISHLVNGPVSTEAISGLATLVGSLAIVALASRVLIGSAHRWWKLIALPIGLLLLALVVMPLTLAVSVTNAPPFAAAAATPADHGLPYDNVTITTADHVRLAGMYIPSTNGASIIVLGGISGISGHEIDLAAVLARHDYGVLLLNVRGQGDSDGDAMLWGWWGEIDVSAAVDYLAGRPDVDPDRIGAVGMSVGGEQAISAAGVQHRLRAVVSEGATARGARDEGDPALGLGGLYVRYVDWLSRHAAAALTAADMPTPLHESLASFDAHQRALLIPAGTAAAELAATRVFHAAAPANVEVWIATGASHTQAYDTSPQEWEHRVIEFLDRTLEAGT